ncbi:MAG: S8 family serine peptidase, partial [Methanoregulaceae archaeon]|nr:S8 family serine peptidase [Methanoregulaceae archaeon]
MEITGEKVTGAVLIFIILISSIALVTGDEIGPFDPTDPVIGDPVRDNLTEGISSETSIQESMQINESSLADDQEKEEGIMVGINETAGSAGDPGTGPGTTLRDTGEPALNESCPDLETIEIEPFAVSGSEANNESSALETNLSLSAPGHDYAESELIVRFTEETKKDKNKMKQTHEKVGAKIKKDFESLGMEGVHTVQLPKGLSVEEAIRIYSENSSVLYAEPNYLLNLTVLPNDASFSNQWGLHNTGQSGGQYDADIDGLRAWDITTGSQTVVVAVVDSGVDYTHPDLSANIWLNIDEIPGNGIDDDLNGYIDDVRGYDFYNGDGDPMDDSDHGTHCAGIIGAAGNNGGGISGVNWAITVMPLKISDQNGNGYMSMAAEALLYAERNGASVASNSYSGTGKSQLLSDVINQSNMVIVCSAGNDGHNIDITPCYPASFTAGQIITVAASDRYDNLASFSNYGITSVDLAAPGVSVLSTVPGGSYESWSGTSMAAPYVSGVAGLIKSVHPSFTNHQIKEAILEGVDAKGAFAGKVLTGGRLNAYRSLSEGSQITIFRNGEWYLDMNRNYVFDWPSPDTIEWFGIPGDIPVVGDWNNDGLDEIG